MIVVAVSSSSLLSLSSVLRASAAAAVVVCAVGCGAGNAQQSTRPVAEPQPHPSATASTATTNNAHDGDPHPVPSTADANATNPPKTDPIERALDEITVIHGAAGPWAALGYRMSEFALAKLGLRRGSFDLQIVHWTPKEVRYSCIADGAAAHSGASLGKLNLSLVDTTAENVLTVYRDKKTGKSIALRPTAAFRDRYADTPTSKARALGREVLGLPADQVFEEIPIK